MADRYNEVQWYTGHFGPNILLLIIRIRDKEYETHAATTNMANGMTSTVKFESSGGVIRESEIRLRSLP
jgi:hypothetical protein